MYVLSYQKLRKEKRHCDIFIQRRKNRRKRKCPSKIACLGHLFIVRNLHKNHVRNVGCILILNYPKLRKEQRPCDTFSTRKKKRKTEENASAQVREHAQVISLLSEICIRITWRTDDWRPEKAWCAKVHYQPGYGLRSSLRESYTSPNSRSVIHSAPMLC